MEFSLKNMYSTSKLSYKTSHFRNGLGINSVWLGGLERLLMLVWYRTFPCTVQMVLRLLRSDPAGYDEG